MKMAEKFQPLKVYQHKLEDSYNPEEMELDSLLKLVAVLRSIG
jgi:hypothetical protein